MRFWDTGTAGVAAFSSFFFPTQPSPIIEVVNSWVLSTHSTDEINNQWERKRDSENNSFEKKQQPKPLKRRSFLSFLVIRGSSSSCFFLLLSTHPSTHLPLFFSFRFVRKCLCLSAVTRRGRASIRISRTWLCRGNKS